MRSGTLGSCRSAAAAALALSCLAGLALAARDAPALVAYTLSFPEPHQRWMQVEMVVGELGRAPLHARMSRSSPGRYAVHEFAKNVWDVSATDGTGRPLAVVQPGPRQWDVVGHDGTVTLRYRVYGDRLDGTYLAVDATHAHMNLPATLMYAAGHEDRPARIALRQPPGRQWTAATQLFATPDPLVFAAPNLAYLMDSPIEFGDVVVRSLSIATPDSSPPRVIRVAMHQQGTEGRFDAYVRDVRRIVGELQGLFGELPAFEPGHYTFIVDYLPWAHGDGMEHRNSTVITGPESLDDSASSLLGTLAHEFVHAWNVERIRPASLEPFSFEDANVSGELWFAEGVTSYVGALVMVRAGLTPLDRFASRLGGLVNAMTSSPATKLRTVVELSRLAPFVDAATAVDRTNFPNTYLSYYTAGAAIGLAVDLELRARSEGRVGLDDYLRALWRDFGRIPAAAPGLVARPYTAADLRDTLATVSGDAAFAGTFFARHVEGREPVDWPRLLEGAGLVVRRTSPGRATLGAVAFDFSQQRAKVSAPTPFGSPAAVAGLAQDDVLERLGGVPVTSAASLREALAGHEPGDRVSAVFTRRDGARVETVVTLAEDQEVEVRPAERLGAALTPAQRALREGWLRSRARE
jgi:predicted metalloprotease with PDZ domain